jgi:pSer/pThr/pTyr-binding forkhead associated (FHA) protein
MISGSSVSVNITYSNGTAEEVRFEDSFTIGRSKEADLTIKEPSISRKHAQVELADSTWWVVDLGSGNGTFLDGQRIDRAPLPDRAVIALGPAGPQLSLTVERQKTPAYAAPPAQNVSDVPTLETVQLGPLPKRPSKDFSSETQIIKHYFGKKESEHDGEQTVMFRRAFERAHQTKSKKYKYLIVVALLLLLVAGSVIFYQKNKIEKMRATAQNIFYLMKAQELQINRLEDLVLLNADPNQLADLQTKRDKFKGMEKEYDSFVKELGIYGKLSEEDRVIMRMARLFGECEVDMPKGFSDEVKRYIGIWKTSDRLRTSLAIAQEKGYTPLITRILKDNNLPPQYFFLALQESNFNERAVGPATRYGNAKGMWQFISQTADRYGLKIGPLFDQAVYDPQDERFNFVKATTAAIKYIKELSTTQAQASGLLVLASYNWGEGHVRETISKMPENPRERNFWRLLQVRDIPKETYDYVFLIFSAAVICENPKQFGFDCACPAAGDIKPSTTPLLPPPPSVQSLPGVKPS